MPGVQSRGGGTVIASATGLTALNAVNAITVAFWAKARIASPGDVFRHSSTANIQRDGYIAGFGSIEWQTRICGAAASTTSFISQPLARHYDGRWAHYCSVFDDATNTIWWYRNGSLLGITTVATDMTSNASCTTQIAPSGLNGSFTGQLFDLQVLPDVAVPASDIIRLMRPDQKYPGVKGRWFGLNYRTPAVGGTLWDESGSGNNLTASAGSDRDCLQGEEPPWRATAA